MIKEIKVDKDTKFEINTAYGWLYIYEEYTGEDVLPQLVPLIESVLGAVADSLDGDVDARDIISEAMGAMAGTKATTLTNILWAMAKNADETIPNAKEWYNSFDKMPGDEVFGEALWCLAQTLTPKKAQRLKAAMKEAMKTGKISR